MCESTSCHRVNAAHSTSDPMRIYHRQCQGLKGCPEDLKASQWTFLTPGAAYTAHGAHAFDGTKNPMWINPTDVPLHCLRNRPLCFRTSGWHPGKQLAGFPALDGVCWNWTLKQNFKLTSRKKYMGHDPNVRQVTRRHWAGIPPRRPINRRLISNLGENKVNSIPRTIASKPSVPSWWGRCQTE